MDFLYIKDICKVRQTWHQKPMFGPLMKLNFKDGIKKLHTNPIGLETQISRRTQHELSFMPSSLPGHCSEKPLSLHIHTSMLAPLSCRVFLYACNGSSLRFLEVLIVSYPATSLVLAPYVYACRSFVGFGLHSFRSSNSLLPCIACNFPCFNTLHLHL